MTAYIYKLLAVIAIILIPIKAVMATVGFLIFLDLFSGIWAAFKRQEKITSAALRRTLSKMVIYQLSIISAFFIEHYIFAETLPVTKIVAGFIGMVEFKSSLENANIILGTDVFKLLISKLGSDNDKPSQ
jgi:hypothetical protein